MRKLIAPKRRASRIASLTPKPVGTTSRSSAATKIASRCFLIALSVLISLGSASAATTNLLSNPGFEFDPSGQNSNLTNWMQYGENTYSETGAAAHSGTNYFKVYQAFTGAVNYDGIYQDYISGPGATYSAGSWAYSSASDLLAGGNIAWVEVTFRDASANVLALYRSASIGTNQIAQGGFPASTWNYLAVTNQFDPSTYQITNFTTNLVAPAGTYFVRFQIVFQGDANNSGGSMYFDDLNLSQTAGAAYGNWNIVWSDEFNSNSINPNVWTYDLGNGGSNPGWGNQELEYYTSSSQNSYVSNGCLHIIALKQSDSGFNYTSARLKTEGLFSAQYGRFEWCAQLPPGLGLWPALWMLGTNIDTIGWPGCGEIDVVENSSSNMYTVQGSLHSGSNETGYYNFLGGDSVTNFHTYTLDWSTNAILFYVDGHLYENQTSWSSSVGAYPTPFNQPFFIIMNLAVGGNYPGNPSTNAINAGTTFPAQLVVDYVRLYGQTAPLQLAVSNNNSGLTLSWPSNIVCHPQMQTNLALVSASATNWVDLTTNTNQLKIQTTNRMAFYRLSSP